MWFNNPSGIPVVEYIEAWCFCLKGLPMLYPDLFTPARDRIFHFPFGYFRSAVSCRIPRIPRSGSVKRTRKSCGITSRTWGWVKKGYRPPGSSKYRGKMIRDWVFPHLPSSIVTDGEHFSWWISHYWKGWQLHRQTNHQACWIIQLTGITAGFFHTEHKPVPAQPSYWECCSLFICGRITTSLNSRNILFSEISR